MGSPLLKIKKRAPNSNNDQATGCIYDNSDVFSKLTYVLVWSSTFAINIKANPVICNCALGRSGIKSSGTVITDQYELGARKNQRP